LETRRVNTTSKGPSAHQTCLQIGGEPSSMLKGSKKTRLTGLDGKEEEKSVSVAN